MPVKIYRLYILLIVGFIIILVSSIGAADNDLEYKIIFKGISDKDLLEDIQSISDAYNIDHQIDSLYLLQKMAASDAEKFLKLLKARGFYNASVKSEINTNDEPRELIFIFEAGKPYMLKSVKLEYADDPGEDAPKLPGINKLGFSINQHFTSQAVLEGQDELIRIIRSMGFPFAKISNREVIVDHQDQSVSVDFYIDTGPKAFFGSTTISGLVKVDESYIKGKLPWKIGDIFNGDLVEEARESISELGLFTSIIITEGKDIDDESRLPMTIDITERKHKSVSLGVKYLTDEGPGAKISWENRNIFHHGEKLSTSFELSNYLMASETGFRKHGFLQNDQTLRLSIRASDYHPEAFESKSIMGSGYIDRDLTKITGVGAGLTIKYSKTDHLGNIESHNLLSFPVYLEIDKSSDILDPIHGYRLSLQVTPYYQISAPRITFGKVLTSLKRYVRISKKPQIVIAAEVTASIMKGASRDDIPVDERLYAGGGGSVRGYTYQTVGPLSDGDPLGGKSLFESSLELRFKLSGRFGMVAFLDGGSAFTDKIFSDETPLKWGTGLGLRYYTPVGPFRLDVGIPLDKREGIDDSYQIYISLGQTF